MADMTCAELIKEAAKIIFQVHDEVSDHRHGAAPVVLKSLITG